jgi:hypothetical protein
VNFEVRPSTITPNGDGKDDVAEVKYTLSASADVTLTLTNTEGKVFMLRRNQPRTASDYQFLFGGIVEGTLLPNGAYTARLAAKSADGSAMTLDKTITVAGNTTTLPEIQNFTVFPNVFTPNRDGIDDRVTLSYHLTKKSDVFVYLLGANGKKYPIAERLDNVVKPGEPGNHVYDYEGGVDLGAPPPPNGTYQAIAEATDALGNRAVATSTLTVVDGGVPRAEIVGNTARFSSTSVLLGGTLSFTATVENVGVVPIRTKGPFSGATYDSNANFNTLAQQEEPGVFRVGIDYEGNSVGRYYPYRWGLGQESDLAMKMINGKPNYFLEPGKRVTITGHIKIVDKALFNPVSPYFWVGLVHEQVRIVDDRIAPTRVTIGF